jgi:methionyl-tRNA synthetase
MSRKFYITTAIDYVNAPPHLGHALEKIQTDVIARYHRILGDEVLFLTGTDENSLKNVQAAIEEGVSVKELVDKNARIFHELKEALNLSFNDFIRTTEERHIKGAQKLWLACKKDIYKKTYKGLYCLGCEEFYKESELENGLCPEHKTKPELIEEENYFFKLSKYQEKLKEIIEKDELKIIPETRKNEVLSFIDQGLEDICISRSAKRARGWGIDVPGDPLQKIWVWFDALSNYITAVGYATDENKFKKWWPADIHVIGKGISRFHCVYWPAILISANLPLPKSIFIHGYITVSGQKMSKSLGNVIDPFELVKKYGTDAVRYFLLREIPPTEDGDFTYEKFEKRYNSDLAAGLGNLVARVINLAAKSKIQNPKSKMKIQNPKLKEEIEKTRRSWRDVLEDFKFNEALKAIWDLITFCDKYIEKERPWELINSKVKTTYPTTLPPKGRAPRQESKVVISNLLLTLIEIAKLLEPFLPKTSEKILKQIETKKPEILFPKL